MRSAQRALIVTVCSAVGDWAMELDPAAALEQLVPGIHHCEQCRLHQSRLTAVPGEGPVTARLVLLGEAPGAQEDSSGRPFVGAAGRLLDNLLRAQALERDAAFITNCVKCRPPNNRPPRRDELDTCAQAWLHKQLAIIAPELIVLLGQVATRQMLGGTDTVTSLHGTFQTRDDQTYFVSYHPAAALRFAAIETAMREDFATLRRWLTGIGAP